MNSFILVYNKAIANKSQIQQDSILDSGSKRGELSAKRYSLGRYSPIKSAKILKNSVSKGDLSTNYSKHIHRTAKNKRSANQDMDNSKFLARD